MKKSLRFGIVTLIILSIAFFVTSQAPVLANLACSTSKSSSRGDLCWKKGDPFPVVDGLTIPPPVPPLAPESGQYNGTHWWVGSYFSESQGRQDAYSVTCSIDVPNEMPLSNESFYAIVSAWDSNSSYDQIGISGFNGTWGLTYSWTYFDTSGYMHYRYNWSSYVLSAGLSYEFIMICQNNITSYSAYHSSTLVWSLDAPTGGNNLILNSTFSSQQALDYTVYEEIYNATNAPPGPPKHNFYFHDQSWMSTSFINHYPQWTYFNQTDPSYPLDPVPDGIKVLIDGGDVYIWNPNVVPSVYPVNVGVSSVSPVPPHYSPFQVYHNGMRYNGANLSMNYGVTVTRFDTDPHLVYLEIDLVRTNVNNASDYRTLNTTQIVLGPGGQYTWTAGWNETNTITEGNWSIYGIIKLFTSSVFDMNTADDQLTSDTVWAKVLTGDIDGSGTVDIFDAITLAGAFGTKPGDQTWNANADINSDGIVDIYDATILGGHFDWTINGAPGHMSPSPGNGLVFTAQTASIFIDPSQITVFKDEVFSVNIKVSNVANLYGWELKLFWNKTVVNCTNYVVYAPTGWQNSNQTFGDGLQINYNDSCSRYWQGLTGLYPESAFNGSMTMVTLTFQAMQPGTASLLLTDVKLADSEGQPINYTATSGYVLVYYDSYMRSDGGTVNGLNAYLLNATETTSYTYAQQLGQGFGASFGIRAWVRASNGTEYEVTLDGQTGTPKATVTGTGWGTVSVTQKSMQTTFSLVIRVYVSIAGGTWTNIATFTTDELGKTSLTGTTWSVYYSISVSYNARLDRTTARFYWGDANHMSRIQNIQFS